ncbi:MAG: hypothetical protein ABSG68_24295 [Thermoguttaceae bacterium]
MLQNRTMVLHGDQTETRTIRALEGILTITARRQGDDITIHVAFRDAAALAVHPVLYQRSEN